MTKSVVAIAALAAALSTAAFAAEPTQMTDTEMDQVTAGGDGFDLEVPGRGSDGSGFVEKDWSASAPQVQHGFQGWDHGGTTQCGEPQDHCAVAVPNWR